MEQNKELEPKKMDGVSVHNSRPVFNPEEIGKAMNQVAIKIDKGEVSRKQETADYFDPEENVEYLLVLEKMGVMETENRETGELKSVPAVYFYAREKDSKKDVKRFIDASTIVVRTCKSIIEEYGPFGCFVSIVFIGQVGKGAEKYNDYHISVIQN